jgi:cobalt-zinc-cadmium efflux system outer membrane protein
MGATRAGLDTAHARRLQAEAAMRSGELELEWEVVLVAQTYSAKVAEIRRWSPDTVTRFRESAAVADRHYRLGAVPLGTYLELQNAYLEAVEAMLETRNEAVAAGLRLQLLTGTDKAFVRVQP